MLKVLAWLLGTVVALVLILVIALQFSSVQQFAARKGASYLSNMLKTEVRIGRFTTDWRNAVVLKEVYIEDQQQDTLWYSGRLGLDMDILALVKGKVNISRIHLQNATLNLHVGPDSSSNFAFLIDAFAGDTLANPADTAAMQMNLGVVNLENVYLNYRNEYTGNFIKGRVGQFLTTFEGFDLEKELYRVDEATLRNTWLSVIQTKLPPDEPPQPLTVNFGINRLLLNSIKFTFQSKMAGQYVNLNLGKGELTANNIDLPNARVDLEKLALHNTTVAYAQEKYTPSDSLAINPEKIIKDLDKSVEKSRGQAVNWLVTLEEAEISGVQAAIDNFDMPKQPQGMDINHLLFTNVNLSANDLRYSQSSMGADINQLKLEEKSGFRVESLQASALVDSTHAHLTDLDLKTGNSHLQTDLKVTYPSLTAALENPELMRIDLDLENSLIGMKDVQFFAPDLKNNPSFAAIIRSDMRVSAKATGTLNNLSVQQLTATGLSGTNVNVSGNVRNLQEPEEMFLDLRINRLTTTRTDVLALLPKGTIPPDLRIPPTLSVTGTYKGTLQNFDAKADVRSAFGNLVADIEMAPGPKGQEPFSATFRTQNLDLAKLLVNNTGLGKVTANGTLKGRGITPANMVARLDANVNSAEYNGYTYKDITVASDINRNLYTIDARSADPNLAFEVKGDINLRDAKNPVYDIALNLKSINLQALNLFPEDLQIQGNLSTDIRGSSLQNIEGTITGRNLIVRHKQVPYPVDSLLLNIDQSAAGTKLDLKSDLATASLTTQNDLATFFTALQKHFSNYFDLQPDPPFPANLQLKDFTLEARIRKTALIASFVPGLQTFTTSKPITASYNSQTKDLKADAGFSRLVYTGYAAKDLNLTANGDRNKIDYTLSAKEVADSTMLVKNLTIAGSARDNTMDLRAAITEDNGKEKFVLGGLFSSEGPGFRFRINPDQLVISGDKWTVPAENSLQFSSNFLYAQNIKLERNGSYVLLNSTGPVNAQAPLQVQFHNFDLGYAMQTVQRTENQVGGMLNGNATLTNIMSGSPGFIADLLLEKFAYMGNPVGDIALKANRAGENRYNINAALSGNGNQVNVTGFYEARPDAGLLNLTANITSLNVAALQGFTQGALTEMGGTTTGQLTVNGTLTQPEVRGELTFRQAQFNIALLNTLYKLENERVIFAEQGMVLSDFYLADVNNNRMAVTGTIFTENYADFRFDLIATTDKFLAMNSTAKHNTLYYGRLEFAAKATVKGNLNLPEIDGTAQLLDGSALTFVIPGAAAGAAERAGVVDFVDADSVDLFLKDPLAEQALSAGFTGVDVDMNISVTDGTEFTIVMDPVTGDKLEVKGNSSNLAAGINPDGDIKLSGRYDLTEGEYKLVFYNLVSRELKLAEGGYIEWNGDPLQAEMQVSAIYEIRASPMELVSEQVSTESVVDRNRYRTPLPFEVYIDLEGDMLKPNINFDIQLEEKERGAFDGEIEAKLEALRQDKAEMEKQAFALLVLGRFLAEDPLQSSGGGLSSTARSSVSQILSDQLNRLTQKYAGGLGLELGVTSYDDYSTGSAEGRTDLNVALRQQFLNDRVTVRVGGDVGVEGTAREQSGMSGFGGDISVELSLTPDGRLRLRGFTKNKYESFVEGDIQETGLALIFVREYNNFSDLFRNLENRKRRNEERKKENRDKMEQRINEDEQELKAEPTKPNQQ